MEIVYLRGTKHSEMEVTAHKEEEEEEEEA
jgi:hypothetical protein